MVERVKYIFIEVQDGLDALYLLATKDLIAFKVYLALLKKIRTNNNLKALIKFKWVSKIY